MATLYIMCGIPGSGKSYYANKYLPDCAYISRDEIRFSLNQDEDHYFAHENEVYTKFVEQIAYWLLLDINVIADATHISRGSRKKLINAIDTYMVDYEIVYIVMSTPYEECIQRNSMREGLFKVPEEIIESMYKHFSFPKMTEDSRIKEIIEI